MVALSHKEGFNMFMVFAGPVDLGPGFIVFFIILAIIIAIPILTIGYFTYTVTRKLKPGNNGATQAHYYKSPQKVFTGILVGSLGFLAYYFSHVDVGPLLFVPYLLIVTWLVQRMDKTWAIRSAIVVILTITVFAYNHYPQYSGRHCKDYPSFLECRTPRFSL